MTHVPQDRHLTVAITPFTIGLGVAGLAGLLLLWLLVAHALDALVLLFIALVVAEGLRPLVDWLGRHRVRRPVAILLLYAAFLGVLALLIWLLVQPLATQLTAFLQHLPAYTAKALARVRSLEHIVGRTPQLTHALKGLPDQAATLGPQVLLVLAAPLVALELLFRAILVLLIAFFWLTAARGLTPFVLSLLPPERQRSGAETIAEMSHKMGGYLRGVVINMAVVALLSSGGLLLLGVPYPFLLGVLAGLTELLPFVGPWISGSAAALVALAAVGPVKAVEVIALYAVIHLIEGNTLVPLVMHRTTDLNPLTVIVAILLGGALLGVVGAVVAVPLAVIVQVLVLRVLAPAARRRALRAAA